MSAEAIPDIDLMLQTINQVLDTIDTPHMRDLETNNHEMFERIIINKYHEILPFKIIRLLLEEDRYDNLTQLLDMFEMLRNVKEGRADVYEEFQKFNEQKNEKYLYPSFGGKDEFIKKMSTVPDGFVPSDTKEPQVIVRNN